VGSGFGEWVYWHFFTITVDYNRSHTELLLNDVCLTDLSEESLARLSLTADWPLLLLEFTNPRTHCHAALIEVTASGGCITVFHECGVSEIMYSFPSNGFVFLSFIRCYETSRV
jgi:hypothetical protein